MIDEIIKNRVEDRLLEMALKVESKYPENNVKIEIPTVEYTTIGRVAGKAYYRDYKIVLNSILLLENIEDMIYQTVPHELAHLVSVKLYGNSGKGHGKIWKMVMYWMNIPPNRTHNYNCCNINPEKEVYIYKCNCKKPHTLSNIKHKRSMNNYTTYYCKKCKKELIFSNLSIKNKDLHDILFHK